MIYRANTNQITRELNNMLTTKEVSKTLDIMLAGGKKVVVTLSVGADKVAVSWSIEHGHRVLMFEQELPFTQMYSDMYTFEKAYVEKLKYKLKYSDFVSFGLLPDVAYDMTELPKVVSNGYHIIALYIVDEEFGDETLVGMFTNSFEVHEVVKRYTNEPFVFKFKVYLDDALLYNVFGDI